MLFNLNPALYKAVKQTRQLFHELDQEIRRYSRESGLHCVQGCGHCCEYPELEATLLEFLPLAAWAWENGRAESLLTLLEAREEDHTCIMYNKGVIPGQGQCSHYSQRGLICRLFGFSARRDRSGQPRVVACGIMKEGQSETLALMQHRLDQGRKAPMYGEYQQRLANIHPEWGQRMYPVNEAIQKALETVGFYRDLGHKFLLFYKLFPGFRKK